MIGVFTAENVIQYPMNTTLLPIGTRVNHTGHGNGTIVAYNGTQENSYVIENLGSPEVSAAVQAGLGSAIVESFYGATRYPYVIKYDPTEQYPNGYQDVYAHGEVDAL